MPIECPICTKPCSSDEYARHHLRFNIAFFSGGNEPSCDKFDLRTYRGIDGVVDHPRMTSRFVDHGPLFSINNGVNDV